jgi:hypothetical protein
LNSIGINKLSEEEEEAESEDVEQFYDDNVID